MRCRSGFTSDMRALNEFPGGLCDLRERIDAAFPEEGKGPAAPSITVVYPQVYALQRNNIAGLCIHRLFGDRLVIQTGRRLVVDASQ